MPPQTIQSRGLGWAHFFLPAKELKGRKKSRQPQVSVEKSQTHQTETAVEEEVYCGGEETQQAHRGKGKAERGLWSWRASLVSGVALNLRSSPPIT